MIKKIKSRFSFYRLNWWWRRQKERFPLVTRRWHRAELAKQLKNQRQNFDHQRSESEKRAAELVKRYSTVIPYRDMDRPPPYEVRLEVTIDPYLLERAMFGRGNIAMEEQRHIAEYFAREIAYRIERELMTVNLATIGNYRQMFQRRYGEPPSWMR